MRTRNAQLGLAAIFLGALLGNAGAVAVSYGRRSIYADDLNALIVLLLTIYAGPLAVIIGGVLGQRPETATKTPRPTFWFAFFVAVLWNVLLLLRSIAFVVSREDSMDELTAYLKGVSAAGSFLVAGSLAYFFSKREPTVKASRA